MFQGGWGGGFDTSNKVASLGLAQVALARRLCSVEQEESPAALLKKDILWWYVFAQGRCVVGLVGLARYIFCMHSKV